MLQRLVILKTGYSHTAPDPILSNPWMDPIHVQLWSNIWRRSAREYFAGGLVYCMYINAKKSQQFKHSVTATQ